MELYIRFLIFLCATLTFIPLSVHGAETPYKIRIGFPSLAFSYLPYYVAQEKGFLKKYNIDSEYIQITNSIAPQAVVAGNINYFTSASTAGSEKDPTRLRRVPVRKNPQARTTSRMPRKASRPPT